MSLSNIYELYKLLENEHSMLSFKGSITEKLLSTILQIMEGKLNDIEDSTKKRKKVYNVLVECLQNLYHHNEEIHSDENTDSLFSDSAILIISKRDEQYEIKTGNYIELSKVETLENKINQINGLNKDELKNLYRSILMDGELSHKGTAGLGLIDIARKSGNKLNYDFLPVNSEYSFFCLNVKIN